MFFAKKSKIQPQSRLVDGATITKKVLNSDWITVSVFQRSVDYIRSTNRNLFYVSGGTENSEYYLGYLHPIESVGPVKCNITFISELENKFPETSVAEIIFKGKSSNPDEVHCSIFLYEDLKLVFEDCFRSAIVSGLNGIHLNLKIDAPAIHGNINLEYIDKHGYPDRSVQVSVINLSGVLRSPNVLPSFVDHKNIEYV
jgi:hypothetical protein